MLILPHGHGGEPQAIVVHKRFPLRGLWVFLRNNFALLQRESPGRAAWSDEVVPVGAYAAPHQVQGSHLFVRDLDPLLVFSVYQDSLDPEASLRCGVSDIAQHHSDGA